MVGQSTWDKTKVLSRYQFCKFFQYNFGLYIWDKIEVLFAISPKVMILFSSLGEHTWVKSLLCGCFGLS
jgi:hypothetical protein